MSDDPVKFARQSITTSIGGRTVAINAGEAWAADDPVVEARPDLFADAPESVRRSGGRIAERKRRRGSDAPVERATAAPGEKRDTERPPADEAPAKKAPAKKAPAKKAAAKKGRS
jgi:hypothetical protein